MAKFPTMPVRTDAFLGDTGHLSATEVGAYWLLILAMWRNGAWLPNDDRLLAKYARLDGRQWKRSRAVIMAFFTIEGDRITQKKVTEEWNRAVENWEKKKGAADARWGNNDGDAASRTRSASMTAEHGGEHDSDTPKTLKTNNQNDADALQAESERNALLSPYSIEEGGGATRAPAREDPVDDEAPFGKAEPERPRRGPLIDEVVEAAKADVSRTAWLDFNVAAAISRWTALGLTGPEIVAVVDAVTKRSRDGPPSSPAYFDRAMQRAAGDKAAPSLTPTNPPAPQQRRTRADDRFARLAARFPDGAEGREAPDEEVAGDQGDDPPRSLLPTRAVGGG